MEKAELNEHKTILKELVQNMSSAEYDLWEKIRTNILRYKNAVLLKAWAKNTQITMEEIEELAELVFYTGKRV